VFMTAVPITKLFARGEGDSGGHVLLETTHRGLCGLVCPLHTSERGGNGDCAKEGGGEEAHAGCGTVCPAVRKGGARAPTIQSCDLVAPERDVHVLVWSP
jgi:hypothetical protein